MFAKIFNITMIIVVAVLVLTGCTGEREKPPAFDQTGTDIKRTRVGMVLAPPGKGDMSLNDAALAALKNAEEQLDIEMMIFEPKGSVKNMKALSLANDKESLSYLAENNFDLVIALGAGIQKDLAEIAPEYPDIRFVIIDGLVAETANVLNLTFASEDSAFMAGAAAASLTNSGFVGFIGGNQMEAETGHENGFARGVQYINMTEGKQVKVLVTYAGVTPEAVKNPARGKTLALQQYQAGADIIYHNAGQSGMGVFQAAVQMKKWVIGSDKNQNSIAPWNTYGSSVKKVEIAVFDTVKNLVAGKFTAGTVTYGLKERGVAFIPGQTIPPDIAAKLNYLAGLVAGGKVVVSKVTIPDGLKILNLNVPVDYSRQSTPGANGGLQGTYPGTPGAALRQPGNQPGIIQQ